MPKQSAGILPFKIIGNEIFFLLGHPGGPFYAKKDIGVWSIIKGEVNEGEDLLQAATREFFEETSLLVGGNFIALSAVKMKSGKIVHAWGLETVLEIHNFKSNLFELEWPPRSGKRQHFPEIDKLEWFSMNDAKHKILTYQLPFLEELVEMVTSRD